MSIRLPEQLMDILEDSISQMMTQMAVPGVSLACVAGGEIIYAKAFGARNLEKNIPITPDSIGAIGSCSKSYTALAIMQLVSEGKLNLNDPINKYVDFKLGNSSNPITIHHFLSHSSGIAPLGNADVIANRLSGEGETHVPMSSWDDFYSFVNGGSQWVTNKPGERFAYLNEGFTILGDVIEKVTNMKYEDYIKEKIFKPLKMERSTFDKDDFYIDQNHMTGYIQQVKDGKTKNIARPHLLDKLINAAGGIMSSVMEQANYLKTMMNGGTFEGNQIIDSNLLEEMFKRHSNFPSLGIYISDVANEGYGYGWFITHAFGEKIIFHPGGTLTGVAFLAFVPDKKVGLTAMCNCRGGEALMIFIFLTLIAVLLGKNPMTDIPALQVMQKLNSFTGVYHSYRGITKIKIENRSFVLHFVQEATEYTPETATPLIPENLNLENNKFYMIFGPGGKMPVEFIVKKRGQVSLFLGHQYLQKVKDL